MEKYNGFDICIRIDRPGTFYKEIFRCKDDEGGFYFSCSISDFKLTVYNLKKEEASNILREAGLKKVYELIDSQQFEYGKECDVNEVQYDKEKKIWRCDDSKIRWKH